MSVGTELAEYVLQTRNSKNSEYSMGGRLGPCNPPLGTPVHLTVYGPVSKSVSK